jgi:hypothetical protein
MDSAAIRKPIKGITISYFLRGLPIHSKLSV